MNSNAVARGLFDSVRAYMEMAKNDFDIKDQKYLTEIFLKLSEKIHPLALGDVYRSKSQIKMFAKRLMHWQHLGKKQEQKIQSEPQIVMNPVNNVNVWNCFIPFYPMNYQIINNINNIYYTNSTQGNIQEKGVDCNMMMQSTSANYSNQMWNYN